MRFGLVVRQKTSGIDPRRTAQFQNLTRIQYLPIDQEPKLDPGAQQLNQLYPCPASPQNPPTELLELASQALNDLGPVGPPYARVDLLQRFEKLVFDGPRAKTFVDNNAINWLKDRKTLQRAILASLVCGEFRMNEVLDHLRLFKARRLQGASIIALSCRPDDDQIVDKGIAFVGRTTRIKHLDDRGTTYEYAVCGSEWAAFFLKLAKLEQAVAGLAVKCLRDGRVLAIEETASSGLLVPPDDWLGRAQTGAKGSAYRFMLTRDLPHNWYYANLGPRQLEERKKKSTAIKWLNGLYSEVAPSGRKATKADVKAELRRLFEITTEGLLDEIWKEAEIDLWRKSGAPSKEKRYLFER